MDDLEELMPQNYKEDMERWNISDLKEYIFKLENEIDKAKKIISRKENITNSVNNLFKN